MITIATVVTNSEQLADEYVTAGPHLTWTTKGEDTAT